MAVGSATTNAPTIPSVSSPGAPAEGAGLGGAGNIPPPPPPPPPVTTDPANTPQTSPSTTGSSSGPGLLTPEAAAAMAQAVLSGEKQSMLWRDLNSGGTYRTEESNKRDSEELARHQLGAEIRSAEIKTAMNNSSSRSLKSLEEGTHEKGGAPKANSGDQKAPQGEAKMAPPAKKGAAQNASEGKAAERSRSPENKQPAAGSLRSAPLPGGAKSEIASRAKENTAKKPPQAQPQTKTPQFSSQTLGKQAPKPEPQKAKEGAQENQAAKGESPTPAKTRLPAPPKAALAAKPKEQSPTQRSAGALSSRPHTSGRTSAKGNAAAKSNKGSEAEGESRVAASGRDGGVEPEVAALEAPLVNLNSFPFERPFGDFKKAEAEREPSSSAEGQDEWFDAAEEIPQGLQGFYDEPPGVAAEGHEGLTPASFGSAGNAYDAGGIGEAIEMQNAQLQRALSSVPEGRSSPAVDEIFSRYQADEKRVNQVHKLPAPVAPDEVPSSAGARERVASGGEVVSEGSSKNLDDAINRLTDAVRTLVELNKNNEVATADRHQQMLSAMPGYRPDNPVAKAPVSQSRSALRNNENYQKVYPQYQSFQKLGAGESNTRQAESIDPQVEIAQALEFKPTTIKTDEHPDKPIDWIKGNSSAPA